MITFSNLGNYGRLGNQMFQYAAVIGIAKMNGYEYCFPLNNTIFLDVFNVTAPNHLWLFGNRIVYHKHKFEPRIFLLPDNIDYNGFFQSEKFFEHCADFIRSEFSFKPHVKEKVDPTIKREKYISIHVRRTDYLQLQEHHPCPTLQWYNQAMDHFPDSKFMVFTDDKEWCFDNFDKNRCTISPFIKAEEDLYAMTQCHGHIIANSTYSWWGAWLPNSSKVIAPKIWYGPKSEQTEWDDVYCKGWIVL